MTCDHIMESTNVPINTVPVEDGVWRCYEATCTLCGERGEVRMKEEMTAMRQCNHGIDLLKQCPACAYEQQIGQPIGWMGYAPSTDEINNLDTEITKLRELLSTPNLTPETIEEANKNLQYLLALKRRPHMEVWTDGK